MSLDLRIPIVHRKGTGYWTTAKKREYNKRLLEALTAVGADIREAENYGLVEQWLVANERLCSPKAKNMAEITWVPDYLTLKPNLSRPEVPIDICVASRDSAKEGYRYPIQVILERDDVLTTPEHVTYRVQNTVDIEHTCKDTQHNMFKSCFHKIFASVAIDLAVSADLDAAGIEHVKLTSFYKEHNVFPMSDDLVEFFEIVKGEGSIIRKSELYQYFLSDIKKFDLQ